MLKLDLSLSSQQLPFSPFNFNFNFNSPLQKRNKLLPTTVHYYYYCCTKSDNNTTFEEESEEESKPTKPKLKTIDFSKLSVTLTVISSSSASFPQHAVAAAAKTADKIKKKKKTEEGLTPQELHNWSQGLPVVSDRIPYTQLLELKKQGKVRNIIKPPPGSVFRSRPEVVLAVLQDDSRVLRIVLPSIDTDKNFWAMWEELGMDSFCVNAFTPPVKKPDLPRSYLGFLSKAPLWLLSFVKDKKSQPRSKKAVEAKRMREELRRERNEELVRMREENDMVEKAIKAQRKMDERQKKVMMKKAKYEESLRLSRKNYRDMASIWDNLASDSNVSTALGLVFFYIFYRTVVLSYKKQKKDYDDRLKMEEADAEERKKMRELEREMGEREEGDDDDELLEDGKGEQNVYMKTAMKFMRSGARVRKASGKRPPQYLERGIDVKFSDVAGLGKIREELEEIVKFFTHGDMYRRRGVKIPGGILLSGPPGVGKTLLAKAVAGEAGVNFFSISASQFVEIYVGVGASRVRALYQEAKDNAPSVVFIDELDAVGRERGLIKGSGGQERDATLNQLLVCLDGFEGRGEVITIASTNRLDILDPALVRSGRFDRKIVIPKPGVIGRMEILKVHARKKQMAEDVDYMAVASMTDGMVGAELANILEIAAINMMRDGRTEITTDDLLQAAQIEDRGMLDRRDRSTEMWKQVAINEAAMAVVAVNFPDLKNIEFVNIAPRAGRELGYVRFKMDHMRFKEGLLSRQSLLDHITVQLAPRAADELWYGEGQLSTIWAETADNARLAARTLVLGGLSEKHYGLSNFWVTDRLNSMDDEALRIMNMCYERANEILQENRKLMDAVVDKLVEKKSLSKQDFFELVELHGSLRPMPPSIVDIRAAKRLEFQNMMMKMKEATIEGNVV